MSARNLRRAYSVIPKHDLTYREIAVLLAVADRTADKDDQYWESRENLAARFGKNPKPLSEVFAKLERLGLLEVFGTHTAEVDRADAEWDGDAWIGIHTYWTKKYRVLPGVPDPKPPTPTPEPAEPVAAATDPAPPTTDNHRPLPQTPPQPGVGETVRPVPRQRPPLQRQRR
jgi:hypothetical protein